MWKLKGLFRGIWDLVFWLIMVGISIYLLLDGSISKIPSVIMIILAVIAYVIRFVPCFATTSAEKELLKLTEDIYANELGEAFQDSPKDRKNLIYIACHYIGGEVKKKEYKSVRKVLYRLKAKAIKPCDMVAVLIFIAKHYVDMGNTEEALKAYNEALEYEYNSVTVHTCIALEYMRLGDYDMAVQHSSKAIDADLNELQAYGIRAWSYLSLKQYDKAFDDANLLFASNSDVDVKKGVATILAVIYAHNGDMENKKKYCDIAIALGQKPERIDEFIEFHTNK